MTGKRGAQWGDRYFAGVIEINPATGELFAPQRRPARIERYLIDPSGNVISNGSFTDAGLNAPHEIAFSRWGELFVVNFRGIVFRGLSLTQRAKHRPTA